VTIVKELPLTASGKVNRRMVADLMSDGIHELDESQNGLRAN